MFKKNTFVLILLLVVLGFTQEKTLFTFGCPSGVISTVSITKCRLEWAKENGCKVYKNDNDWVIIARCSDKVKRFGDKSQSFKKSKKAKNKTNK